MKRRLSAFLLVLGTALTAFVASAAHAQPAAVERGLPDFADLVERTHWVRINTLSITGRQVVHPYRAGTN